MGVQLPELGVCPLGASVESLLQAHFSGSGKFENRKIWRGGGVSGYRRGMRILKHAMNHIRKERGTGNCQDAIARNRALNTLKDAEWRLVGEEAKRMVAA